VVRGLAAQYLKLPEIEKQWAAMTYRIGNRSDDGSPSS
jgi:hypothetical protein